MKARSLKSTFLADHFQVKLVELTKIKHVIVEKPDYSCNQLCLESFEVYLTKIFHVQKMKNKYAGFETSN